MAVAGDEGVEEMALLRIAGGGEVLSDSGAEVPVARAGQVWSSLRTVAPTTSMAFGVLGDSGGGDGHPDEDAAIGGGRGPVEAAGVVRLGVAAQLADELDVLAGAESGMGLSMVTRMRPVTRVQVSQEGRGGGLGGGGLCRWRRCRRCGVQGAA